MNVEPKVGSETPWGRADHVDRLADGVYFVATPSHGGIWLSPTRKMAIPAKLRKWAEKWSHGMGDSWYEEDCCIYAVAHTFPELFPKVDKSYAQRVIDRYATKREEPHGSLQQRR